MPSTTEEMIAHSLRTLVSELAPAASNPQSDIFRHDFLNGLEWWLPGILGEVYPELDGETFDGVYVSFARKTAECEAEIAGMIILISDQTLVPFHLWLQVEATKDEISWLLLKFGEALTPEVCWMVKKNAGKQANEPIRTNKRGMARIPYSSLNSALRRVDGLEQDPEMIDWIYKVTFGERRPG